MFPVDKNSREIIEENLRFLKAAATERHGADELFKVDAAISVPVVRVEDDIREVFRLPAREDIHEDFDEFSFFNRAFWAVFSEASVQMVDFRE